MSALELIVLAWMGTYLVHSTLWLGLAWIVARYVLSSARGRELLWRTALVGGVLTAGVQSGLGLDPFGGRLTLSPPEAVASSARLPRVERPGELARLDAEEDALVSAIVGVREELASGLGDGSRRRAASDADATRLPGSAPLPTPGSFGRLGQDWRRLALYTGAGIATLLALGFGLALVGLRRRLAHSTPVTRGHVPGLVAWLRRESGMRRTVRIFRSPLLSAPIALGVLRPTICLPPRAIDGLDKDLQRSMLAHEVAHLARFDPFWLGLARTLEVVLFFQPLGRVARRSLGELAELRCDDQAVERTRDPVSLARCLAEVATWLVGERRGLPVCGMAELRSPLGERVERILDPHRQPERRPLAVGFLGVTLIGAVPLVAPGFALDPVATAAAPEPQPEPRATPLGARLPAAPPQPSRSSAPPAAAAALVTRAVEDLARELEALEAAVAELRVESRSRRLPEGTTRLVPEFGERLARIESRVLALRARKDRMDQLTQRLFETSQPAIPPRSPQR